MVKVFYYDRVTLQINFICLGRPRFIHIPLPEMKDTNQHVHFFMDLLWHQGQKVLMIKTKSHFVKLYLSDIRNISYELVKKSKNTRKITNGYSNQYLGTHYTYDDEGKKLLTIIEKHLKNGAIIINHKYQNSKISKLNLHSFGFQQFLTFGENDRHSLVRYNYKLVIIDNKQPNDFQTIENIDTDTITAFYWDIDDQKAFILMKRRWYSLPLKDGKWGALEQSNQKVDYCFGEWDSKLRKFVIFDRLSKNINPDSLEVTKWIKHTKKYHLTINDITQLQSGEKLTVVHLDRNVLDSVEYSNKASVITDPHEFFKQSVGVYTHQSNLVGNFEDVDFEREFEFDVEYKKNHWYPLEEGHLPTDDEQRRCSFGEKAGWNWRQFPTNTRIGWRGPMIEISKLKLCPKVYWLENEPHLLC